MGEPLLRQPEGNARPTVPPTNTGLDPGSRARLDQTPPAEFTIQPPSRGAGNGAGPSAPPIHQAAHRVIGGVRSADEDPQLAWPSAWAFARKPGWSRYLAATLEVMSVAARPTGAPIFPGNHPRSADRPLSARSLFNPVLPAGRQPLGAGTQHPPGALRGPRLALPSTPRPTPRSAVKTASWPTTPWAPSTPLTSYYRFLKNPSQRGSIASWRRTEETGETPGGPRRARCANRPWPAPVSQMAFRTSSLC